MEEKSIEIRQLGKHTPYNEVERLYDIMIHAYAVTEGEIWGTNFKRMSRDAFFELVQGGGMIGVWVDVLPVGSIHVKPISSTLFSFGVLSVDFDFKGMHLGRKLIESAEEWVKLKGGSHLMLELLRPEQFELPFKTRLRDWYMALGYEFTETVPFPKVDPNNVEKEQQVIVPCVFDRYQKKLI